MLVDAADPEVLETYPGSGRKHCIGKRVRLDAIEATDVGGHQKRGHLVVRDVTRRVGTRERAPFTRLDPAAVSFAFYESVGERCHDTTWNGAWLAAPQAGREH
jgi:hypothetical protein